MAWAYNLLTMRHAIIALVVSLFGLSGVLTAGGAASARDRLAEAARLLQEKTAQRPFAFREIGVFDVASAQGVAGAGFFVKAEGKVYAVTAKHPHPKELPTQFVKGPRSLPLGKLVRDADDVLLFVAGDLELPTFTAIHPDGVYLRKGDAVTVICHDGARTGSLNGIGLGMDELLLPGEPVTDTIGFTVPGKHDFRGNSGAPVVLNKTGEVLGVLLKAVDVGRESMLDFMPLTFRVPFEKKPMRAPAVVFSMNPLGRPSSMVESNCAAMFPPELLEVTLGMPMAKLAEKRPYLPAKGQPDFHGEAFYERLGKRDGSEYLFHEAGFIAARGELNRLELRGYGWTTNVSASRLEGMFEWFFQTIGVPNRALDFTKKDGRPGYGGLYCTWTNGTTVVALGVQATGKQYRPKPFVSVELKVHRPRKEETNESRAALLPNDLTVLRREIREFVREVAEMPEASAGAGK